MYSFLRELKLSFLEGTYLERVVRSALWRGHAARRTLTVDVRDRRTLRACARVWHCLSPALRRGRGARHGLRWRFLEGC